MDCQVLTIRQLRSYFPSPQYQEPPFHARECRSVAALQTAEVNDAFTVQVSDRSGRDTPRRVETLDWFNDVHPAEGKSSVPSSKRTLCAVNPLDMVPVALPKCLSRSVFATLSWTSVRRFYRGRLRPDDRSGESPKVSSTRRCGWDAETAPDE